MTDQHFSAKPNLSGQPHQPSVCANCGHHNPVDATTCLNCTTPLANYCPICGHSVPVDSRFCGQCGAKLPVAATTSGREDLPAAIRQQQRSLVPAALAGKLRAASSSKDVFSENREVTLLYISLTCASAPNVDLDEEEIYFSRDNLLKQLSNIVKKYDGTLEKFTSHGLVAFFGAPVAHENDPERAVRAALDMQKLIQARQRELAAETDLSLSARIGLHTGSVVAGAIGSKNIHMDYTVVGNAVQVTQEIEQSAAAGDIVISNDTYRHVRSICECVALLPINLPDPPIVIQRFKVAGLLDNAEMSDPLMPPTLMIGRARELGQLQTALAAVIGQERSQAVLITGAAGLGKSRLVTEFRHLVNGPNKVLFLQGTCPAYTRALPLG